MQSFGLPWTLEMASKKKRRWSGWTKTTHCYPLICTQIHTYTPGSWSSFEFLRWAHAESEPYNIEVAPTFCGWCSTIIRSTQYHLFLFVSCTLNAAESSSNISSSRGEKFHFPCGGRNDSEWLWQRMMTVWKYTAQNIFDCKKEADWNLTTTTKKTPTNQTGMNVNALPKSSIRFKQ